LPSAWRRPARSEARAMRRRGHPSAAASNRAMRFILFVYPGETDPGPTLERSRQ
jgi:hypothetical protein